MKWIAFILGVVAFALLLAASGPHGIAISFGCGFGFGFIYYFIVSAVYE